MLSKSEHNHEYRLNLYILIYIKFRTYRENQIISITEKGNQICSVQDISSVIEKGVSFSSRNKR